MLPSRHDSRPRTLINTILSRLSRTDSVFLGPGVRPPPGRWHSGSHHSVIHRGCDSPGGAAGVPVSPRRSSCQSSVVLLSVLGGSRLDSPRRQPSISPRMASTVSPRPESPVSPQRASPVNPRRASPSSLGGRPPSAHAEPPSVDWGGMTLGERLKF